MELKSLKIPAYGPEFSNRQTLHIILVQIVEYFYINFNPEILYRIYLHQRLYKL